MVRKVSITMPDELYDKLGGVRNKLNISEVCRRALETEIKIQELVLKADKGSVIERLRLEKSKFFLNCEQQGRECGIESARVMSYVQLRAFHYFCSSIEDRTLILDEDFDEDRGWEVKIAFILNSLPKKEKEFKFCQGQSLYTFLLDKIPQNSLMEESLGEYVEGFINGVVSFYENIKDQIGDGNRE